eukprot:Phypoly_transcript_09746.p1 GENE.Phypoly_transcript_09746~~Phypoly_transcript_09746.p1  ORF type:complete len:303 (+),score=37.80 Phypoly_transcript_09746:179-1087(+)
MLCTRSSRVSSFSFLPALFNTKPNNNTHQTKRHSSQILINSTKSNHNHTTQLCKYNPQNKIHPAKRYSSQQISTIGTTTNNQDDSNKIPGLHFKHQYMDDKEQKQLLDELYDLNAHVWRVRNKEEEPISGVKYDQFLVKSSDLFGRTVIHIFGHNLRFLAEPKATHPTISTKNANLLLKKLAEQCKPDEPAPNVVQANFYKGPGTGCSMHVDDKSLGKVINMVNLQSEAVMSFLEPPDTDEPLEKCADKVQLLMKPGTLVTLRNDARYAWAHGVRYGAQSIKRVGDTDVNQGLRVSIVGFRY